MGRIEANSEKRRDVDGEGESAKETSTDVEGNDQCELGKVTSEMDEEAEVPREEVRTMERENGGQSRERTGDREVREDGACNVSSRKMEQRRNDKEGKPRRSQRENGSESESQSDGNGEEEGWTKKTARPNRPSHSCFFARLACFTDSLCVNFSITGLAERRALSAGHRYAITRDRLETD